MYLTIEMLIQEARRPAAGPAALAALQAVDPALGEGITITAGSELIGLYRAALARWDEIHARQADDASAPPLAQALSAEQYWFENHCGGQSLGQEIMVLTGIAAEYAAGEPYSEENKSRARRVCDAFQKSYCSSGVKSRARSVGCYYALGEDD